MQNFNSYSVEKILNKFQGKLNKKVKISNKAVEIFYPCRLDAMAINPAAVCYNTSCVFTPGEVVVSINKGIRVGVKVIRINGGVLRINTRTGRKVLAKHAYYLMCNALNVSPSLEVTVDDSEIIKHCGMGSSSSTISAVASAINELYGHPIENGDLIKYLAANHGEEVDDKNENEMKLVQCIGGGATGGLTDAGIMIIAGQATCIAKLKYEGKVIIGIPNDFESQTAEVLMNLEEKNLWKFKKTGIRYKDIISYNLLHKAIPEMCNGGIKELSDVVFDYRFNMGSIKNCSFVYKKMNQIASQLRELYTNNHCQMLALSSVGPAFFVIVNNENDKTYCENKFLELNMKTINTTIKNTTYDIISEVKYGK